MECRQVYKQLLPPFFPSLIISLFLFQMNEQVPSILFTIPAKSSTERLAANITAILDEYTMLITTALVYVFLAPRNHRLTYNWLHLLSRNTELPPDTKPAPSLPLLVKLSAWSMVRTHLFLTPGSETRKLF